MARRSVGIFTTFVLALTLVSRCSGKDPLPKGAIAGSGHTVGYGELKEEWRGEVIHLSWSPRSFLLRGFLSDEECDHLIKLAKPSMVKSAVADNKSGKSVPSDIRTSTGTFFSKGQDEIIQKIEKRVAQVTMVPIENQEGLQILNYHDGQKYEAHYDYFHDAVNQAPSNGGQRLMTMLMYLTTVDEGGETVFPNADRKVTGSEWSDCAKKGLAVKTYRGDALLFYSLKPDGSTDPASLHGSCPTSSGEKWSATKWIHVGPFGGSAGSAKAKWNSGGGKSDCEDSHEQCSEWTFFGECEKNPQFMMETCRKSCKACDKQ